MCGCGVSNACSLLLLREMPHGLVVWEVGGDQVCTQPDCGFAQVNLWSRREQKNY